MKLDVMIEPTSRKNWLTFGGDPALDTDSEIISHFSIFLTIIAE